MRAINLLLFIKHLNFNISKVKWPYLWLKSLQGKPILYLTTPTLPKRQIGSWNWFRNMSSARNFYPTLHAPFIFLKFFKYPSGFYLATYRLPNLNYLFHVGCWTTYSLQSFAQCCSLWFGSQICSKEVTTAIPGAIIFAKLSIVPVRINAAPFLCAWFELQEVLRYRICSSSTKTSDHGWY